MKKLIWHVVGVLLFGVAVLPTEAGFKSLYIFGDGLSTTTDNKTGSQSYYGKRYSNGRVWVEVLAQRQGLTYDATKNNSYFDHNSTLTAVDVAAFVPPPDVANDLFIVWVNNADTYDEATVGIPLTQLQWQLANTVSVQNHLQIITNLYAKGVRTLIMPNVVDLSKIPFFDAGTLVTTEHNGCVDYNTRFANTIAQARALCPGLTIYTPDFYALLNNVLANPASYGLTNALQAGHSVSAIDTIYPLTVTNNPATNYIYWDSTDPSAKFHAVIADVAQQIISPAQISGIAVLNGSNRLDLVNVPVGLNGFVDGATNLIPANWTSVTNMTSTATAQSIFVAQPVTATTNVGSAFSSSTTKIVPADAGDPGLLGAPTPPYVMQYYRLRFPYAWNWP